MKIELTDSIWETLYGMQFKGPSYMGARECFNENGAWMGSLPLGYDFFCDIDNNCGYIRYWSDRVGDVEYIHIVTLPLFNKLYYEYVYGQGVGVMMEYEETNNDGVIDVIYREVV